MIFCGHYSGVDSVYARVIHYDYLFDTRSSSIEPSIGGALAMGPFPVRTQGLQLRCAHGHLLAI